MGRACLVTGSSRGIGRAVAVALGRLGLCVAVHCRSRRDAAEAAAREVEAAGGRAAVVQGDLAIAEDRFRILEETERLLGPLSVHVQNAGAAPDRRVDLLEEGEESLQRMLAVNLAGPWALAVAAARRLLAHDGPGRCLVWITSVSAAMASVDRAGYCLAKAGAAMGARLLAVRLAPAGIPVWEVRPGVIETDMTAPVIERYRERAAAGLVPEGRVGRPEEVAEAVAALVAGRLPYSTGAVINVDGGMHLERL